MRKWSFILVFSLFSFLSCKKDYSCEGCNEKSNKPPLAVAGPDQIINAPVNTAFVDGSGSYDPDGTIRTWLWRPISGPVPANITNPGSSGTNITDLVPGTYEIELKVTDNRGLSDVDTTIIVVTSLANRPPVADAGTDQTIFMPVAQIQLDGSGSHDPDNNLLSYAWTKISGPGSVVIATPNAMQSLVTNVVQGIYEFELKVTDAGGLFSKDSVAFTIVPPPACTDCKIVFVSSRDGNMEIYTCRADGTGITRLTYSGSVDEQPVWSPDGTKIAFTSGRSGGNEIYTMDADGSNVVRRTFTNDYCSDPAWSPDGTRIAFATLSNGSSNIWVVNTVNGQVSLLYELPGYDVQPVWAPNGTRVAFVSDWMAYDFVLDIYTINTDGTGFTSLTGGNIFDQTDYTSPAYSPDGLRLSMLTTVGYSPSSANVAIMSSNGTGITTLRSDAALTTRTAWSPDGNRILYTSMLGSRKDVSWVTRDGITWGTIVIDGWNADWR